jgi:hypothetical protein
MNTLFLKSDLEDLTWLVEKLKESEQAAEKALKEETIDINNEYAYKYGIMCGRMRALSEAFESRLNILNKSLTIGTTKLG